MAQLVVAVNQRSARDVDYLAPQAGRAMVGLRHVQHGGAASGIGSSGRRQAIWTGPEN